MNTMKNFDLNKLEYYYDNMISFKCADIIKWCETNLDNSDFNIQYAANDIYKNYFNINNDKKPSLRAFYYIIHNTFSNNLYKLLRDPVLSPTGIDTSKGKCSLYTQDLINATNIQFNKIDELNKKGLLIQSDKESIKNINDIFFRRIINVLGENFDIKKYYKYTQYQKSQIYFIHKNRLEDLKTLIYMIKCCNK